MTVDAARHLDDVNISVSGQGGDGSLTVTTVLADLLRGIGLRVYTERDVLSRIKGGYAAASLRASREDRHVLAEQLELVLAFEQQGVSRVANRLAAGSVVVFDDSEGPLPDGIIPSGVRLLSAPFGRLAVHHLGRTLYKNSIAMGVAARVLGLDDEAVRQAFRTRFTRLKQPILDYNLQALELGFTCADERGLASGVSVFQLPSDESKQLLQITGNEAVAFGFLVAGGRFFAGYPITPATDVMVWLQRWLPKFGGVVRQAEDELAAVNMVIGSSLAGVRSMTATSGPGLALMQEGIGHAGSAEVPIVIVDSQRAGPSTGLPTKPEQSDFDMMIFGGNGEFPRIVLTPGSVADCFEMGVQATNLAQRYQCPVYIALDQGTSQNLATSEPFDLAAVTVDDGKLLSAEDLQQLDVFKRYALTDDGISPYTVPSTPGGMWLVTGNERDEFGQVNTQPGNRLRMVAKRARKLDTAVARGDLPIARRWGDQDAEIGFMGVGAAYGPIHEAMEQLAAQGIATQYFQTRTLWPLLDETIEFVATHRRTYVVELNSTAQIASLLVRQGAPADRIRNVLRYDGLPMRPDDVVSAVLEEERS